MTQEGAFPDFQFHMPDSSGAPAFMISDDGRTNTSSNLGSKPPLTATSEQKAQTPDLASHNGSHDDSQAFNLGTDFSYDFDESSLAYFLNDIMLPVTPVPDAQHLLNEQHYLPRTPRDFLDFGINLENIPELDILLGTQHADAIPSASNRPLNPLPGSGTRTPIFGDGVSSGNAAFMRSVWMWTPTNQNYGGEDNLNLSLPYADMESPETQAVADDRLSNHFLDNTGRDKILVCVITTCDSSLYTAIASSFPSAQLLNKLLHFYMTIHLNQVDAWLHLPTLDLGESFELAAVMVAAGAVLCSVSSIRKLGFALQEACRNFLAEKVDI